MIGKLVETFFRHKLLILVPSILIPLMAGLAALLLIPKYYEARADVWVDRSVFLKDDEWSRLPVDAWGRTPTLAQHQTSRLGELLRNRAFRREVAKRTPLAPLVGSDRGEERLQKFLQTNLQVTPSGDHLVVLRFRGQTPDLALQVLQAVLDTFNEKGAADRSDQATRALLFYEARLQAAEEQLANAQGAMSRYVATRPDLTRGGDGGFRQGLPLHAIDPQLGELQNRLEADQGAVARAREALEQARVVAAASLEGQKLGFQTLDPPQLPTRARRDLKTLAMFPAAGLLVGLGLSAALLVLLVALDRSVRSEAELARIGRVVGVVPYLQLEPGRPRRGPDPRHWWPRRARELITRTASPAPAGGR